jgi:phosphatidate cytidylyltransferase
VSALARRVPTALAYGAVVVAAAFGPWPAFVLFLLILFVVALVELARLVRASAVGIVLGATYLIVGLGSLAVLWGEGRPWLFLALLPTWAADIAGYAVGSTIGRRALAPRLSPGKTWEGTLASFVVAALVAVGMGTAFGLPGPATALAAVGIGPVALAGDLLESQLKRRAGVKDSGSLLPGHGGVLDRIDSLLAVGPLVVLCLWLARGLG